MAVTKKKTAAIKDYVVFRTLRRGMNTFCTLCGPFTKAEASAYAMHHSTYSDGEYTVEHVSPLPHYEKWILKDVSPREEN